MHRRTKESESFSFKKVEEGALSLRQAHIHIAGRRSLNRSCRRGGWTNGVISGRRSPNHSYRRWCWMNGVVSSCCRPKSHKHGRTKESEPFSCKVERRGAAQRVFKVGCWGCCCVLIQCGIGRKQQPARKQQQARKEANTSVGNTRASGKGSGTMPSGSALGGKGKQ